MLYIYHGENLKPANIGFNTLAEVYANISKIKMICESEKNIHVSMNHCQGDSARTFVSSDLLYFDIDKSKEPCPDGFVELNPEKHYQNILEIIFNVTTAAPDSFYVNSSGNGLHFVCHIPKIEFDIQYTAFQAQYKKCLDVFRDRLLNEKIHCVVDYVLKKTQTLRVPQTVNEKNDSQSYIIQKSNGKIQNIIFNTEVIKKPEVFNASGLNKLLSQAEQASEDLILLPAISNVNTIERIVPDEMLGEFKGGFGTPDTQSVLTRCHFLKHCAESPAAVREPEWYAMLSITSRLENGRELSHQMSQDHPKYDYNETDIKITRALDTGGPRTCKDINAHWGNCKSCAEFGKIQSPITLKSKQHIATKGSGFHFQEITKSGGIVNKPDHQGMVRHIANEYNLKVTANNDNLYVREGTLYKEISENDLKSLSRAFFKPDVFAKDTQEFLRRAIECLDIKTDREPNEYEGLLNCKNGVVDLFTGELLPHSPDFFFTTEAAINYDKDAVCPQFDDWLQKIFKNNQSTIDIVLDYLAYAMVGTNSSNERFMVFQGSGANGKSVLIKIMKKILGEYVGFSRKNSFMNFGKDIIVSSRLVIFEELPKESDDEFWQEIKDLSAGGVARVNRKFKKEINYQCKSKFLFTCNELPHGTDHTNGFYRRLLLVKFPVQFADDEIIPNFEESFDSELSGIMTKIIKRIPDLKKIGYKIGLDQSLKDAADELKLERDIVYQYFKEFFAYGSTEPEPTFVVNNRISGEKRIRFDDLYTQHFMKYCEDSGIRLIPKPQLKKRLKQYLKDDFYFCEQQRRYLIKNVYPRVS